MKFTLIFDVRVLPRNYRLGKKSLVVEGQELPRGGPGACSPGNVLKWYTLRCNLVHSEAIWCIFLGGSWTFFFGGGKLLPLKYPRKNPEFVNFLSGWDSTISAEYWYPLIAVSGAKLWFLYFHYLSVAISWWQYVDSQKWPIIYRTFFGSRIAWEDTMAIAFAYDLTLAGSTQQFVSGNIDLFGKPKIAWNI